MIRPIDATRPNRFRRRRGRPPSWVGGIALAASLFLSRASAAPPPVDVRLLSEDESGVLFEYILPDPALIAADGERVIVRVPGSALAEDVGFPAVPSRALLVALPPGAAAEARIIESTVEESDTLRIAPMPELVGGRPVLGEWSPDLGPGLYPGDWVTTEAAGALRDVRVARVVLHPVRYDRASGRSVFLKSAKVQVRFLGGASKEGAPPSPSRDPFDPVYEKLLLNHASGAAWKTKPSKRGEAPEGDSFESSDFWIRMEIAEKGLHRVSYADFLAIGILDPRSALGDPRAIRIFAGDGLPLDPAVPGPPGAWMREIAIRVSGEEDGSFDPWDFIEFYALPPFGWRSELAPGSGEPREHVENPYTTRNVCWLTRGGAFEETPKRMGLVPAGPGAAGASPSALATFPERIHSETDLYRDFSRYGEDGWFMERFSPSEQNKSFLVATPDADTARDARVRIRLYHYANDFSNCGSEKASFTVNGVSGGIRTWNSCVQVERTIQPFDYDSVAHWAADGESRIDIGVSYRSMVYLCWIEIGYERFFRARDGALSFRIEAPGSFRVPIAGFSADSSRVLDVTDPQGVKELTGLADAGDSLVLHVPATDPRAFYAFDPGRVLRPASFERASPADIRTAEGGSEHLILFADELAPAAAALAAGRSAEAPARLVRLSDVYADFAGGLPDPTAIRDFLSYAVHHGPEGGRPISVLLVGDAVDDTRDRGEWPNRIVLPSFLRVDRGGSEVNTYITDDYFTYLGTDTLPDSVPDLAIGRLPAQNAEEASRLASKVGAYREGDRGAWRGRAVFAADDERKGTSYDCGFLLSHTAEAEALARLLPDRYEKERVYMVRYPLDEKGEKPEATADLVRLLRDGALFFSYSGHGGFDKLADEDLLDFGDLAGGALPAGSPLPLFTAWACDVGAFGIPWGDCLAEALLHLEGAGAIAAVAGTAPTFSGVSGDLAERFVGALFPESGEGPPVGMALLAAKASLPRSSGRITNDEKYLLLGDPTLRLVVPALDVRFPGLDTLVLERGSERTLHGEVVDESGALASWFDGTASVVLRADANPGGYLLVDSVCYGTPGNPRYQHVDFTRLGPVHFDGAASVVGGRFSAPFFVPLDIAVGPNGRAAAYVVPEAGAIDAFGGTDSLEIATQPDGYKPNDRTGPLLEVRADGRRIRDGSWVRTGAWFDIALEDPSGIYQGSEDEQRVGCVLDGSTTIDFSSLLALETNGYTKGSVRFRWPDLPGVDLVEGEHAVAFHAFDNVGNGTDLRCAITFVPELPNLYFRQDVINYPNPFDPGGEETEFFVDLSRDADVRIQIFTLNGKRIRVFEGCRASGATRLSDCAWDGRDEDGDPVANGVYLVRAIAVTPDGSETTETIGKAIVMKGR